VSSITINAFLYDDDNEEKFAAHGVTAVQVDQVLDGDITIHSNRKERRGLYLVIGRDYGGRCLAVPIEPTHDPVVWRPITAWPCKPNEEARL
jgi:uncharacterized DUF497 family protein